MKAIGIVGSPRMKNTYNMTKTVLEATGVDYEIILLKDKNIKPCNDCRNCHKTF
ncbi:MAG: flavodoxin family protein, partial [Candidatus Pacebacteria bacterium]|nr:flavodoxin family protein [Candidatus Paceibacterota bacterium]